MESTRTKLDQSFNPLLQLRDICLRYGDVEALHNVNLDVRAGEIHAIVGEHGAGKTSLGLIITGHIRSDSGHIMFARKFYDFLTPELSRRLGIEMVTQYNPLFDYFTVANNILVNNRTSIRPFFNSGRIARIAGEYIRQLGFSIDPRRLLENLNLSDRVLVDILKHIYPQPKMLVLDEALEKLSAETLRKMLPILRRMKSQGTSILFITHRIDDVYSLADRVTIIRDGNVIITETVSNIDKINLIKMAYTQFMKEKGVPPGDRTFYELLKYNEAILESLPMNLIVFDANRMIKIMNDSAKSFFCVTGKEIKGIRFDHLFTNVSGNMFGTIKTVLAGRTKLTLYQIPIRVGNRVSITNIRLLPIFDGSFFLGNIMIIEDITEQEKLREKIVLSENLSAVGLLAAGVAHEINNPLEIIMAYLQHIRFNLGNKKLLGTIENIEQEITTISYIVGNLITFSDRRQAFTEDIDVNDLVKELINLLKYNAGCDNISITFSEEISGLTVRVNRVEIKQAILNIIRNSLEAMPDGGELDIATEMASEESGPCVRIFFTDTGRGINDDEIKNVFLPFFSTKKNDSANMGLGLSISYGIVRKYNGAISVENRSGSKKGCVVTVTLPISPKSGQEACISSC